MNHRRGLLVALALALIAAAVISVAVPTPAGAGDADPVQVGTSRVGDEVTYTRESSDQGDAVRADTFSILERTVALAAQGSPHPAVVVATRHDASEGVVVGGRTGWGGGSFDQRPFTQHEFIDLASRDVIRVDIAAGERDDLTFAFTHRDRAGATLPGVLLQGRTLRLGDDLGDDLRPRHPIIVHGGVAMFIGFPTPVQSAETGGIIPLHLEILPAEFFDAFSWKSRVDRAGAVDGSPALGLTTTAEIQLPQHPESNAPAWERDLAGMHFRAVWTDWYLDGTAYPVLVESATTSFQDGQEETHKASSTLAALTLGPGPAIEWDPAEPIATLERAPAGSTLEPGTGPQTAYPLGQAMADVDGAVALAGFQLWRTANPDARLAQAQLAPSEYRPGDTQAWSWNLVFATSSGDGWGVTTQRIDGAPTATVDDDGQRQVAGFDSADLGPTPLTLAAAVQAWQWSVPPDYRDQAPNVVQWGPFGNGVSQPVGCLSPAVGVNRGEYEDVPPTAVLLVGWTTGLDCSDAGTQWRQAVLEVDLASGRPLESHSLQAQFEPLVPALGARPSEDVVQQTTTYTPVAARVQVFAWAATSLFALVLVAYFLPVLKYAGAHALLLVPGYSRLDRDQLLDQKVRDQVAEQIRQDPGVTATQLKATLGIGWGTTVHHLRILERNKLVSSLVDGRHRRFFPTGVMDWSQRARVAVLKNESSRRLFDRIVLEPGVATSPLARHLGVTTAAAMWHLRRLEEAGLVGHEKRGRSVHYFPLEAARTVLEGPRDAIEFA